VRSDISSLLQKSELFSSVFDEEANFCAGGTQVHTHSATCVKYSIKRVGQQASACRFGAPWKLIEKSCFDENGVLKIRRNHSLVNRWNKAIAVGLRHNHDISFILTKCKSLAIIFYLTNYTTKVEDPVWKRTVAAQEIFQDLADKAEVDAMPESVESGNKENKTRLFLLRVANRVFTQRALSQVEVMAHLLGYGDEFANNDAWTFLNVTSVYWHIFRQWKHLHSAAGREESEDAGEEPVLLQEAGQKISFLQAYMHRGRFLQNVALYDYMTIVKLKRKGNGAAAWGEIEFDSSWPFSKVWVQSLRRPGKSAVVCLDGNLSMNFAEEDEHYYKK
jgi:hypothetical protein